TAEAPRQAVARDGRPGVRVELRPSERVPLQPESGGVTVRADEARDALNYGEAAPARTNQRGYVALPFTPRGERFQMLRTYKLRRYVHTMGGEIYLLQEIARI